MKLTAHIKPTALRRAIRFSTISAASFAVTYGCGPQPRPTPKSSANPIMAAPAAMRTVPPADPQIPVQFVDITEQAGIRWTHFTGQRGRKYMPECETPGCAFIDFNGDGKPDILLLNGCDWPEVTKDRK